MLDDALNLLAATVFPFLALLAIQWLTVSIVRRFMMRPSKADPEQHAPEPEEAPRRGCDRTLSFLEAGNTNGIVLTGPSYARYQRARGAALQMLGGIFGSLLLFLLVSLAVALVQAGGAGMVVLGLQAATGLVLFLVASSRYLTARNPLSTGYAVVTAFVLLIPALVGAYFQSWQSLAIWPIMPLLLWLVLWWTGHQARRFGKQDLLVLRVFGSDASAVSTFGTIARSWRYLGPTITIADPSYVRFEFSATNKGNRWRMIIVSLAFGLTTAILANPFIRAFLTSLPGLSGLTEPQLFQAGKIVAILVLIPAASLPVVISVWRKFLKDREALLRKIKTAMGSSMRLNGTYALQPYYCHDDLWRPAVEQMMEEAEIVLMDFRGFDPSKRGCEYEIGKVLDTVPVHRLILLLDGRTDHQGAFQIFRERWATMASKSPNRNAASPVLKVFTAYPFISWRDGIWSWLKSLVYREKRWKEDAERILAFIATGSEEHGAVPIP